MATIDLADLVTPETETTIYQKLVDILEALGVATTTWKPGDPTRSLLYAVARLLAAKETIEVSLVKAGFLELAEQKWLTAKGASDRDVVRQEATFAECSFLLTSTSVLDIPIDPEDLTLRNSTTGATYRNTTGGTLLAGGTLAITIRAEVAGSGSSATIGEIDQIVTSVPGVTGASTTVAVGLDEESDADYRDRCRDKLASISGQGPDAIYDFVARTVPFNGGANVTQTQVVPDNVNGTVPVYLAGPSGAVSAPDVERVQLGFDTWAEPLTIQSTAISCTVLAQAVTYQLWVYSSIGMTESDIEDAVEEALRVAIAGRKIGGDIIPPALTGTIYKEWIEATILNAVAPHGFRVSVTVPAADVALAVGEKMTLGAVSPNVDLIS
jgi:uncharacterized phage protein gp47/JayE